MLSSPNTESEQARARLFVKFTVKLSDMPTVTDHPVMSVRKEAILGRSSCSSLNNPFRCSWNVTKSA